MSEGEAQPTPSEDIPVVPLPKEELNPRFQKMVDKKVKIEEGLVRKEKEGILSSSDIEARIQERREMVESQMLESQKAWGIKEAKKATERAERWEEKSKADFEKAVAKQMKVEEQGLKNRGFGTAEYEERLRERREQLELRLRRDDPRFGGQTVMPAGERTRDETKPEVTPKPAEATPQFPHIKELREKIATKSYIENVSPKEIDKPEGSLLKQIEERQKIGHVSEEMPLRGLDLKERQRQAREWLQTQPNGLDARAEKYITDAFGGDILSQMRGIKEIINSPAENKPASAPSMPIEGKPKQERVDELSMPDLDTLAQDPKTQPIIPPVPIRQDSNERNRSQELKTLGDRAKALREQISGWFSSLRKKPEINVQQLDPTVQSIQALGEQPELTPDQEQAVLAGSQAMARNDEGLKIKPVPLGMSSAVGSKGVGQFNIDAVAESIPPAENGIRPAGFPEANTTPPLDATALDEVPVEAEINVKKEQSPIRPAKTGRADARRQGTQPIKLPSVKPQR